MSIYPKALKPVFEKLKYNNIKAVIVGGFIRDYLLGTESKDIDIELYNASSLKEIEKILCEFGKVYSVGKSFGVCKLDFKGYSLDFSLPRTDNKISKGHRGFEVITYKNIDFKTAASRRDFRINAIGYDVEKECFLDPFDGMEDIKNNLLRFVDAHTFKEDPLRVLRAVVFHARYNLKVDKELFLVCKEMVENSLLDELPKERIYTEIQKLLLKSKKPSLGFEFLKKLDALRYFLKCLDSMEAIDRLANIDIDNKKTKEILMLSTLSYRCNEKESIEFLKNFTDSKELQKKVLLLKKALVHLVYMCKNGFKDYDIYKLASIANISEVSILSKVIYNKGENISKRAKELGVLKKELKPLIGGKELIKIGLKPSPRFSKIINKAYEAQMNSLFFTKEDAIKWLRSRYLS